MKQEQKSANLSVTSDNSDLASKLADIKKTPETRTVRLKYTSCCGCGCHDIDVTRKVAYDSPLKNGDYITKIEKNDKY